VLRRAPRTQDEKLPLHYAAAKGAPLDVMKLLLEANLEAVNAADTARR
jgi:ankyrin repeat protein